jgi:DNA repair ATPase RecN
LGEDGKAIVKKLREWAGELVKVAGLKRKHMHFLHTTEIHFVDNFSEGSEHEKQFKEPKKKSTKPTAAPVFTKKENATLAQQIEILDWHREHGRKQTLTAGHFAPIYPNLRIKQPLISSWAKDKAKWQEQWEQMNHQND